MKIKIKKKIFPFSRFQHLLHNLHNKNYNESRKEEEWRKSEN